MYCFGILWWKINVRLPNNVFYQGYCQVASHIGTAGKWQILYIYICNYPSKFYLYSFQSVKWSNSHYYCFLWHKLIPQLKLYYGVTFMDRFLQTAEMLKPSTPSASHDSTGSSGSDDGAEYYPHIGGCLMLTRYIWHTNQI